MNAAFTLKCLVCGKQYSPPQVDYVCPEHGDAGVLDVQYDYVDVRRHINRSTLAQSPLHSIWRYKPLLPVAADAEEPPLAVGWTPLYPAPRLAAGLGLKHVWVKDDGRQPSASLKDRASAVALVKARETGARVVTTASTGNAAAALSAMCASMGQDNVIFVPRTAPQAKIAQLLVYGSRVVLVNGTYDDAFDLCQHAAKTYGWYNRNTGYNPYMTEGKKTAAYEICEQLGWRAPHRIFVSVGDGCIIGGLHKGLKDLLAMGWIERMPRLMGVQAEGSAYLYEAWQQDQDVMTKPAIAPSTVADSISAGLPRDRIKAMAAVRESRGAFITVSDARILDAIPALARTSGVFAEPAGAAAYAGLVQAAAQQEIDVDERVVVLNTGNGLKDVAGAMQAVEAAGTRPLMVDPDPEALHKVLDGI